MVDRHLLADRPAHRCADHVGALDFECIEQASAVGRHVAQSVGSSDRLAHERLAEQSHQVGCTVLGKPGRTTDVAVVEADDEVAARGELLAERLVPGDHLRRQSHDEQQRWGCAFSEGIVTKLNAVGGHQRGVLLHPRSSFVRFSSPAMRSGRSRALRRDLLRACQRAARLQHIRSDERKRYHDKQLGALLAETKHVRRIR